MSMESHSSAPTIACDVDALRNWLQARSAVPVEVKETHLSWVLLTRGLAFKLKKPVRLTFADFSTTALRKHYCEEELRLNRRLAPSLYRKVIPVCGSPDAPHLGGQGAPIDYVVCMRRFPDGALLSEMLEDGRLRPSHVDGFARRLSSFHDEAPVRRELDGETGRHPVFQVLQALQEHGCTDERAGFSLWATEQSVVLKLHWDDRRRAGAVRECHGDLHLSNVVAQGAGVTAFDCVEFDPALRWIDVMSDVGFLTMDLKARGRADLAFRFLDAYLQYRGDYAGLRVLHFEEVYRALVRWLVACISVNWARQAGSVRHPDYASCAEKIIAETARGVRLLITCGLSGSGKSSLAGELLECAGAIRLRSDVERKRLAGLHALQRSDACGEDLYTEAYTRATYERLACCAREVLSAGYPVIVDAAFLRCEQRQAFRDLAARLSVPFSILHCEAGIDVLKSRVALRESGRADPSEATVDVLLDQLSQREALDDEERRVAIHACTEKSVDVAALWARWRAAS